jgi:hypothetical protein
MKDLPLLPLLLPLLLLLLPAPVLLLDYSGRRLFLPLPVLLLLPCCGRPCFSQHPCPCLGAARSPLASAGGVLRALRVGNIHIASPASPTGSMYEQAWSEEGHVNCPKPPTKKLLRDVAAARGEIFLPVRHAKLCQIVHVAAYGIV